MIAFHNPLVEATFLRRENRFRAAALLDGHEVAARLANSGRLAELLIPGRRCYLAPPRPNAPDRRTAFDLVLIEHEAILVSLDTHLPNALFADALARGVVDLPLLACGEVACRREVRLGHSRIDFLLTGPDDRRCWVEVKSVSLVENGAALFPDAPTERGVRHLNALIEALTGGDQAALAFVVQRCDARAVAPHRSADPAFAAALEAAACAGVSVRAYTCRIDLAGAEILEPIPVLLAAGSV